MTNKEAEDIAYKLLGVLEHRGHPNEVISYVHEMIVRLRRSYPKIDEQMEQYEKTNCRQ